MTQSPKLEKCLNIEKKRQNVDKNFEFKQIHKNQNSDKYKFQNSSKNTNKNLPILDITKLVQ